MHVNEWMYISLKIYLPSLLLIKITQSQNIIPESTSSGGMLTHPNEQTKI